MSRLPDPRPRAIRARLVVLAALTVFVQACDDTGTGPEGTLLAAETGHGALSLEVGLPEPDLSEVVDGMTDQTAEAINTWHRSWQIRPDRGRALRDPLYGPLSSAFAERLAEPGMQREIDRLGRAVEHARALDPSILPPAVADGIRRGGAHWERAVVALERGESERAADNLLRGSDALREIGAEAVARTLWAEASEALQRIQPGDPYPREDMDRARRLVRGSEYALREGAWELAIRRAYYAKGLLNGGN